MTFVERFFSKKALLVATAGLIAIGGAWYLRPSPKLTKSDIPPQNTAVTQSVQADDSLATVQPKFAHYASIDEFGGGERATLHHQLNNLKKTGSLSGGALTHEFKQATHAKMTYRFGRRQPLSFEPVHLAMNGFVLTGRQYEGVTGQAGFDGLYRLFENPDSKARLELIETKIEPDKPVVLVREFITKTIGITPIIYESLTDKKGVRYYNARFVHGDKLYVMSAKGMSEQAFDVVIGEIVNH